MTGPQRPRSGWGIACLVAGLAVALLVAGFIFETGIGPDLKRLLEGVVLP